MKAIAIIMVGAGSLASEAHAALAVERVKPMVQFSARAYSDLWQLGLTALVFDQPGLDHASLVTGSLLEPGRATAAPLDFEDPVNLSTFREDDTIYIPGPSASALVGTGTVLLAARRR